MSVSESYQREGGRTRGEEQSLVWTPRTKALLFPIVGWKDLRFILFRSWTSGLPGWRRREIQGKFGE